MALKLKAPLTKPGTVNYKTHLTSKPIVSHVSQQKTVAGQPMPVEVTSSTTEHPGVLTDGASITVEGGRTLNLGNYESARIGVSLTVPCDMTTLNETYEFATSWVSDKIEEAVKLATKVGS